MTAAIGFFSSPYYQVAKVALDYDEPYAIASYRLANLPKSDFEREISEAIDAAEFDDARQIVAIGEAQGHAFDPDLVARTVETPAERTIRESAQFARGFVTGDVRGVSGFAGAVSSDFMIVGDIRDILIQGPRAISGQDYDRLVLGLSLVGIATVLPSGPIDVGASVLKTAKRTGKMSARLSKTLGRTLTRLVDVEALKAAISGGSTRIVRMARKSGSARILKVSDKQGLKAADKSALVRRFDGVLRAGPAQELAEMAAATQTIAGKGGLKASVRALAHADTPADLGRIAKLSARTGDKTAGVLKLLGKGSFRLGRLLLKVVYATVWALGWFLGAVWYSLSLARTLARMSRRMATLPA
ncbi:hypothetical protein E2A64_01475 [Pseudohoeflea suaedae]|uniref:Uncharacterized protein n=1 Tax=Pseudohoeflea suaedae TaxID=877384 RepID=A0A4R5PLW9_9HYPH|nr:hypothetical protein [Pseudohoeflea suaedae]TDH37838.1 hypothetical protein E2A64_01475 [Pseudohoeflea suaedae]